MSGFQIKQSTAVVVSDIEKEDEINLQKKSPNIDHTKEEFKEITVYIDIIKF